MDYRATLVISWTIIAVLLEAYCTHAGSEDQAAAVPPPLAPEPEAGPVVLQKAPDIREDGVTLVYNDEAEKVTVEDPVIGLPPGDNDDDSDDSSEPQTRSNDDGANHETHQLQQPMGAGAVSDQTTPLPGAIPSTTPALSEELLVVVANTPPVQQAVTAPTLPPPATTNLPTADPTMTPATSTMDPAMSTSPPTLPTTTPGDQNVPPTSGTTTPVVVVPPTGSQSTTAPTVPTTTPTQSTAPPTTTPTQPTAPPTTTPTQPTAPPTTTPTQPTAPPTTTPTTTPPTVLTPGSTSRSPITTPPLPEDTDAPATAATESTDEDGDITATVTDGDDVTASVSQYTQEVTSLASDDVTTTIATLYTTDESSPATAEPQCECPMLDVTSPLAAITGRYRLDNCTANERPFYTHIVHTTILMYSTRNDAWCFLSSATNPSILAMHQGDVDSPLLVDDESWTDARGDDLDMRVTCLCDVDVTCERVTVESSSVQTQFPGYFTREGTREGRPYYLNHQQAVYMYYHHGGSDTPGGDNACPYWNISPELEGATSIMHARQDVESPMHVTRPWSVATAPGSFSTDASIRVVCA